jgi:membrane protein insertase Oxa1/YidC/SpoIIIJ
VIFWLYGVLGIVVTALLFVWPFMQLARLLTAGDPYSGGLILVVIGIALALFNLSHKAVARLRRMRHRQYKIK